MNSRHSRAIEHATPKMDPQKTMTVRWTNGASHGITWPDKAATNPQPLNSHRISALTPASVAPAADLGRQSADFSLIVQPSGNEQTNSANLSISWSRLVLVVLVAVAVAFGIWARYHIDNAFAQMNEQIQQQNALPVHADSQLGNTLIVKTKTNDFVPIEFKRSIVIESLPESQPTGEPTVDQPPVQSTRSRIVARSPEPTVIDYSIDAKPSGLVARIKGELPSQD